MINKYNIPIQPVHVLQPNMSITNHQRKHALVEDYGPTVCNFVNNSCQT